MVGKNKNGPLSLSVVLWRIHSCERKDSQRKKNTDSCIPTNYHKSLFNKIQKHHKVNEFPFSICKSLADPQPDWASEVNEHSQIHIQNPFKHLRWSILQKKATIFAKCSILDVWQGSEYTSAKTELNIHTS